MHALGGILGAAVAARNALYDRRLLKTKTLTWPVVSIGNISAGGAGKTPFTIWLGQRLAERGIPYSVLSRGYGRKTRGVRVVQPEGGPAEYGDEPLLLARALGAPVVVGASRYAAGLIAEKHFPDVRLHLLDDGFQHRALHRDFDIVLLAPEDLSDRLLPAGMLREPVKALQRADMIALPLAADDEPLQRFGKPVWRVARELLLDAAPARPVVFCGLARPQQFFKAVRDNGVHPATEIAFRDHHRYTEADAISLQQAMRAFQADGFVTTEKDAINLGAYKNHLQPLTVAGLQTHVTGEGDLLDLVLGTIAERRTCPKA